ncbi:MAG: hypothetical protein ACTSWA_03605 [Candidatus Thorarchaeota archaeon]
MNKDYLRSNINEEIERAKYLKSLFPRPIPMELTALADRCRRILDDNISYLLHLKQDLESRPETDDIRDLYRNYRHVYRLTKTIEYYGISALHFQSDDVQFLNRLLFRIQQELNVPFVVPNVACFSNNYYWIECSTNVLFMPIGEAGTVLHLPDIFHELGHATIHHKDNDNTLEEIKNMYQSIADAITSHYQNELNIRIRQTGPDRIPLLINHLHTQWKEHWLDEFFSDLFACYTLGPAYAWAHLHLTTKNTSNVYNLEAYPIPQTHPSDDSRMKLILLGLKILGYNTESDNILRVWNEMSFVTSSAPQHEYQFAYPRSLMERVAHLMYEGMEKSGFTLLTPDKLSELSEDSIRKILNKSWIEYWENSNYIEWEKETIQKLKKSI